MFHNPFSFVGRIRRTEYGISVLICYMISFIIYAINPDGKGLWFSVIATLPILWFLIAQGAKRCHDRENSGWYQIIPFYFFWMLFADSDNRLNKYGVNPKDRDKLQPVKVNLSKRIIAAIFGLALWAIGVWIIYGYGIGRFENNNKYGVRIGLVPLPKEAGDTVFNAGEIALFMLPFLFGFLFIVYAIKGKWN
jgi:uncharacterized membrane protein YhaH (DUF805 family)